MNTSLAEGLDVSVWRRTERVRLLAARVSIPLGDRDRQDERINEFLQYAFSPLAGLSIGTYWPMKGEVDPRPVLERWRAEGSRIALPVVVQKAAPLKYFAWGPGIKTKPGNFGLPVPQGTEELVPDAVLMPPVGFDARGYRLGFGGGYFDRTLAYFDPQPLKIGVAREATRIETIHPQPYDIPMDFVVTERGVHDVTCRGLRLVTRLSDATRIARRILDRRGKMFPEE